MFHHYPVTAFKFPIEPVTVMQTKPVIDYNSTKSPDLMTRFRSNFCIQSSSLNGKNKNNLFC